MEEQRPAGGRCPPPLHAGRGVRACLREAAGAGEPRLASPASGANTAGPAVHLDGVACIPGAEPAPRGRRAHTFIVST